MRILVLMGILLSACAPARGPVDRVGPTATVTEPGGAATATTAAPPVVGSNGLPFSLRLF